MNATVFVIVQNIWPEGFLVHGIFPTLETAVQAVPELILDEDTADIEEVPFGKLLRYNHGKTGYSHNTTLNNAVGLYDLQGKQVGHAINS